MEKGSFVKERGKRKAKWLIMWRIGQAILSLALNTITSWQNDIAPTGWEHLSFLCSEPNLIEVFGYNLLHSLCKILDLTGNN